MSTKRPTYLSVTVDGRVLFRTSDGSTFATESDARLYADPAPVILPLSDGRTVELDPDPYTPGYLVPTMVLVTGRRVAICAGREPLAAEMEARRIANACELDIRWAR